MTTLLYFKDMYTLAEYISNNKTDGFIIDYKEVLVIGSFSKEEIAVAKDKYGALLDES